MSAGGATPKGNLFIQAGAIHATFRVYGNTPAIIRHYIMDCSSWPFVGGEDSRPNLTLLAGATKTFTCLPQITTTKQYKEIEDPQKGRIISMTKSIQFKMHVEYEDVFHRIESKEFCFSNRPQWDRSHLRSCEESLTTDKSPR